MSMTTPRTSGKTWNARTQDARAPHAGPPIEHQTLIVSTSAARKKPLTWPFKHDEALYTTNGQSSAVRMQRKATVVLQALEAEEQDRWQSASVPREYPQRPAPKPKHDTSAEEKRSIRNKHLYDDLYDDVSSESDDEHLPINSESLTIPMDQWRSSTRTAREGPGRQPGSAQKGSMSRFSQIKNLLESDAQPSNTSKGKSDG